MIKKHFKKLVSVALAAVMVMGMSITAFAAEDNNSSSTTVINNPTEIAKVAAELDLSENPDDIVEIIISDSHTVEDTPSAQADILNPEEYVFKQTYHNSSKKGRLIRSSDFAAPGGSMTVSESVSVTFTTETGISADVISAKVGFSVTGDVTVSDTQQVSVPTGQKRTCNAYVKLDYYEYHVTGDDVWFDDDLGTVTVSNPVGVIFVITR